MQKINNNNYILSNSFTGCLRFELSFGKSRNPSCLAVFCFPRIGASATLRHHSGDGVERHTGGEATVLVRRPVLLQRLLLGPAQHQEPKRAGDGR